MKRLLLAFIPAIALAFAIEFLVYSYSGEWPEFWAGLLGFFLLGVALGSRRLLP